MKSLKVHFYLKSEADKDKPALIYVSFTVNKRYKRQFGIRKLS